MIDSKDPILAKIAISIIFIKKLFRQNQKKSFFYLIFFNI